MEFSVRSMRLLIKSQCDIRVSEKAATELGEHLEKFTEEIAEDAVAVAREDGYQTVQGKHLKEALNQKFETEVKYNLE